MGRKSCHPFGTLRMANDERARLAPRLAAQAIARFRICGGSVMLRIVAGNANASVIMTAERCAEFTFAE
ncbi:hypothetical protein EN871_23860 [bacterium M00.F.Ca.ET.228.01.1.1]|uniref:GMC oxidoreductase n=1 Tax=Paraburkholderia phenoliruptrix TaxID=252970 RepID=UPI00109294B5|nr:GMC oxidoreductase [Paraburkholderia phenoliruptrix]TGP41494.1 hypothetical protein EN871_23860 [bacterium M00.F.Ca.ET.228.01.1.1]TGR98151.1 hypothetical protein EN834_23475 [bacterium M00.F.Ca.ET.191.01.1.1]TGU02342.1 hypothetical protein EN798_24295 [bacterium M00.F.Ca.ET.155.01.1.1]MBW0447142.1 hypothetical protein [Paraburkholderia phenoliruptrix]MBW9101475.1 hypothetical protein [Paraburkholderia phenoliruptrix]